MRIDTPKLLMNDKTIKMIACGGRHSMIYKENGELLVMGNNEEAQLGMDINSLFSYQPILLMADKEIKDISLGDLHSLILRENGELLVFGKNAFGIENIFLLFYLFLFFIFYFLSTFSFKFLKTTKNENKIINSGQLGNGNKEQVKKPKLLMKDDSIEKVVGGLNHSLLFKKNGELYTFGCG